MNRLQMQAKAKTRDKMISRPTKKNARLMSLKPDYSSGGEVSGLSLQSSYLSDAPQESRSKLDKRSKIIESASSCFLRQGYAECSLDEVAAHSLVVKQTIYNYFGSKDAVFKACVEYLLAENAETYETQWYQLSAPEFLEKLARLQLKTLSDPRTMDFLRLIVKECRRFPELQQIYASSIPNPYIEFLTSYIAKKNIAPQKTSGRLSEDTLYAIAWAYRACISGFATLSNLSALLAYPLPNRSRYLSTAAMVFANLIESDFSKIDETEAEESSGNSSAESCQQGVFFDSILFDKQAELSEKKTKIISAAIKVFSSKCFADCSMEEIAEAASVSKQTVYKHFKSKNYLYGFIAACVLKKLQALPLPDQNLPLVEYFNEFVRNLSSVLNEPGLREYLRAVFGEAKGFPLESGSFLLFIMEHGRQAIEKKLTELYAGADLDFMALSILIRSMLGSYFLLSQIYVVGGNISVDEKILSRLSCKIMGLLGELQKD